MGKEFLEGNVQLLIEVLVGHEQGEHLRLSLLGLQNAAWLAEKECTGTDANFLHIALYGGMTFETKNDEGDVHASWTLKDGFVRRTFLRSHVMPYNAVVLIKDSLQIRFAESHVQDLLQREALNGLALTHERSSVERYWAMGLMVKL